LRPGFPPQNDYRVASEFYDLFYNFKEDVQFYLDLAKDVKGPILDVMCGSGRIALHLARAGHEVVGLDASEEMLGAFRERLNKESEEVRSRVRLVRGDVRSVSMGESFGMAVIAWSSISEIVSLVGQGEAIGNIARHLKPGGFIALHTDEPSDVRSTDEIRVGRETAEDGSKVTMYQTCVCGAGNRCNLLFRYEIARPDGKSQTLRTRVRMKYASLDEMKTMMSGAGLDVERVHGDYDLSEHRTGKSKYIIMVARRPTEKGLGAKAKKSSPLSRSLWGVFFADTTAAASLGLFIMVYPLYITELGGDAIAVGIIFSASLVMAALSYIPGAILVHRVDRKKIMIYSLFVPVISILILYNATSWVHVLMAELAWYASNFGAPAFITYITEASPKEKVMRSFGYIYAGPALALVIAPIVGGVIVYYTGAIREIFPFALLLRLIAPLFLLVISPQLPKSTFTKGRLLVRKLFKVDRIVLERIVFLVVIAAVVGIGVPYLPLFLSDMRGFDAVQVNLLGAICYLGAAVLSIALGELGSRRGGTFAVLVTISCFVAGCAILLGLDMLLATVLAVFLLGVMTAITTILDSIVGLKAPEESIGGHLSLYLLIESVAMAPMPAIGGLLYDRVGPEWPFIVGAALALIMIAMTAFRRDLTETPAET